ncbi:AGMAT [Branchiostoma lanceolatum]|uniref:AGMAT protein n=1 Tax=Branchiostoma lanceolatum TaxID=7740 RepID=A0A8J9Z019_BRALA|nr:AGMAT [Branchiostoma lanceolatum]
MAVAAVRAVATTLRRSSGFLEGSRSLSTSSASQQKFNVPPSGNDLPRPGGIASMMRLPVQNDTQGLDACFVGIPLDIGTSNRSGTRFGPRQIRTESVMLRPYNNWTGAAPYDSLQVADIGDVFLNMYDLKDAVKNIRDAYTKIVANGCKPLTLGGDHTLTYPILQAIKAKYGPVGLVHVDAHADTNDKQLGEKISHGTPFRRAVEEGLLDCQRVIQIGLRGTGYSDDDYGWSRQQDKHGPVGLVHVDAHADTHDQMGNEKVAHGTPFYRAVDEGLLDCNRVIQIGLRGTGYTDYDYDWSRSQGFRVVQAEEVWYKSLAPLMEEVRAQMGDGPVYLSFDIDALDPAYAPGTGTPEIGGLTSHQGLEIIRGCRGLNLVGGDLVEVSPAYDPSGNTALTAANLLFEMLCVLPGVQYRRG